MKEIKRDNSKKTSILFFETYSVIQIFLLITYVRKAKIIYFYRKTYPTLKQNLLIKKIVVQIIYLVNKDCRIETPPTEKINKYNWTMNKKAIKFVDELCDEIKHNSIYSTILKIIHDENIIKYYKAKVVDDISASLLFYRVAKDLVYDYGSVFYVIPAGNDHVKIQDFLFGSRLSGLHILRIGVAANQIRYFFFKIFAVAMFILLPTVYVLLNMKRITFRKVNKKHYDIAMPVMYGFHDGEVMIDGVRRIQTDGDLYNKQITLGHIVHIFSLWRFSPDIDERYRGIMKKRGIPYTDTKDYRITPKLLLIVAKIQFKIIIGSLLKFFYIHDMYDYIWCSNKIIYGMFNKYLEFENVDYKVELVRHDYSPIHIVGTIMCNQNNKKTVGIQHHINAFDFPSLSFMHFDKYIVFGDILVNTFLPHWKHASLQKTGRENIDWVVSIVNDKDKISRIRNLINDMYGERKYIVLFTFPSGHSLNRKEQWVEVYEGLKEITEHHDLNMHFFLRLRSISHLDTYSHLQRFRTLVQSDKRLILDHEHFTTQELMAISDMVIANSVSFSIWETLATRARVFSFDFIGVAPYYFTDYGKDFILRDRFDLVRAVRGLHNNFKGFDCKWDQLRKDCNYYYDGNNLERIRKVFVETVGEVNALRQGLSRI